MSRVVGHDPAAGDAAGRQDERAGSNCERPGSRLHGDGGHPVSRPLDVGDGLADQDPAAESDEGGSKGVVEA